MKFSKLDVSATLVYLLPLAILTGSFVPDLLLCIVVILFLFFFFKKKNFYLYKNFLIFFTLYYFYLIFSSLFSEYQILSIKSSLPYVRFIIFTLAVHYLIDNKKNFLKNFFYCLYATFIIVIISGYFQYFTSYNLAGIVQTEPNRLTLAFNEKSYLGGYISRLLPLLIGLMFYSLKPNKLNYIISFITITLSILLVFISGERTALGLIILFIIFIFLFISNLKWLKKTIIISTAFLVLIIVSLISYDNGIKERQFDHTITQLRLFEKDSRIKIYSIEHEVHMINAFDMFKKNIVFGIGPNTFREECKNYPPVEDILCSTHPHNNYIQLAAETGLIGIIFLLVLLFYLLSEMIKHIISLLRYKTPYLDNYQVCLMGCLFLSLWPAFPTLNLFNGWINIIYFLPVGFYLHSNK